MTARRRPPGKLVRKRYKPSLDLLGPADAQYIAGMVLWTLEGAVGEEEEPAEEPCVNGHTIVRQKLKPATGKKDGKTAGKYCSVCFCVSGP